MLKERVFLLGRENMQLVRLIGSFMFFGAIIMILYSAALMFENWEAIKKHSECMASTELSKSYCSEQLYRITGVYPSELNGTLSLKQKFIIMVKPVAQLFFWAVVFFFGTMLYNTRKLGFAVREVSQGHTKHSQDQEQK